MNKLCCEVNPAFTCNACGYKMCQPCHAATEANGYDHSHTIGIITPPYQPGGGPAELPFFCPVVVKIMQVDRMKGILNILEEKSPADRFQQQINYHEALKKEGNVPQQTLL